MAYVIGSQKGKDIAKNMKTGETYKASDGSTWTKKSDGSVSVTHNGKTYDNAYSSPSSSSGGSSSGGSSGSSSNKNSQYTGYNYTIGSDLGKKTAQNMGIGQTWTATDGSEWYKENDGTITVKHGGKTYKNAYIPSDYSTLIGQQIAAGVPYQDVLNSIYARLAKASGDPELNKYMYDDVYNMGWNYILENMQQSNQPEDFSFDEERPNAPKSDPRIDELLNQILNREDFSYDVMNDPLYQQYRDMYQREGDRAMRNTLAEAAAGAGGMNTYAMTAAMQANNYYNSQLADKVPELYNLAYSMYLNDIENDVQNLGILQNMDATQYARYRDTMNDWYNDRNFAYGKYLDDVNQGNIQTNFNYNAMTNDRNFMNNNYWNNKEWDANQADKEYNRNQTETENAKADIDWLINNGVTTISPELIERAGLTQEEVDQMIANHKAQQAKTGSSSGGSNVYTSGSGGNRYTGGRSGNGYTGGDESSDGNGWQGDGSGDSSYENSGWDLRQLKRDAEDFTDKVYNLADSGKIELDTSDYTVVNQHGDSWVSVWGYGRVSYQELYELVESGKVKETVDHKNKRITYK